MLLIVHSTFRTFFALPLMPTPWHLLPRFLQAPSALPLYWHCPCYPLAGIHSGWYWTPQGPSLWCINWHQPTVYIVDQVWAHHQVCGQASECVSWPPRMWAGCCGCGHINKSVGWPL